MDYVKSKILDDDKGRKDAYERLMFSLQGAVDPWSERVKHKEQHKEFETINIE
jgi:nitrite reductase (NADH) large subunit